MNFKYFADYKNLALFAKGEADCNICGLSTVCFNATTYGDEHFEHICPQCVYDKKLYSLDAFLNEGKTNVLLNQVKELYKNLSAEQQHELVKERTMQLEKATPPLITWQPMDWPCLDGDYAKFIGYGSKPFFNLLSYNGDGQQFYKASLHADLQPYYTYQEWEEMIPGDYIKNAEESNSISPLTYVFKSLISEKFVVWWDCL